MSTMGEPLSEARDVSEFLMAVMDSVLGESEL